MKIALALIIGLFILAGCASPQPQNQACIRVITPAISPQGECIKFATPCDVPSNYTKVNSCPQDLCAGVNCKDKCAGYDYYSNGTCSQGVCNYEIEQNSQKCSSAPIGKYEFDANLLFCDFDPLFNKYTFFYQIRNMTDNSPTYKSKIWLKAEDENASFAYDKTVQSDYKKNRIMWEEQRFTYVNKSYRGQFWEIRNQPEYKTMQYKLIFCEPAYSSEELCNENTGIVIDMGDTNKCTSPQKNYLT